MLPENPTPAADEEPPTFTDAAGRTWTLVLTIGLARRIKEATAVDFGRIADGRLFLELGADPYALAQVLYLLCEKQAETDKVGPEAFAEGLDGDTIDKAMEALISAIVLFTRAPMRGAIRKVIQTTLEAQATSLKAVEAWTEANATRMAEEATRRATAALSTFGEPSPSSPRA